MTRTRYPDKIILIRHGESVANAGIIPNNTMPDHLIPLSDKGKEQALQTGQSLGSKFIKDSLIYVSPYGRTRETWKNIKIGAGIGGDDDYDTLSEYEDPRLREVERGFDNKVTLAAEEEELRKMYGWFYYRFQGGESPADCFDRQCTLVESIMRQFNRKYNHKNVIIVSHGITIRCFVMRWMHMTVEQFNLMRNPSNCGITTISSLQRDGSEQFTSGKWWVTGLNLTPR